MSQLLHRRRGHDSEEEDEEGSIVSGMTTTDCDEDNDNYTTSDEDDSQEKEETDSEYDSSEQDTDTGSEQEEEIEQQSAAVVGTSTKVFQRTTTTTSSTNSQTAEIQGQVNSQPKPPSPAPPTPMNTTQTVSMDYQDLQQQQEKEKTVQELREYRRKLAEDPSFVPYVGLFWGHDDRYREDSLATTSSSHEATRESLPHFSQHTAPNSSIKKPLSYDRNLDPLVHKKWDHSGYEELLRLEEKDERRKRELIESGQSPSQVDHHHHHRPPPRLPKYHHHNNNGGRGRGSGYRGGYHHQHNRYGTSQRRPLKQHQQQQQQEEWPQLATTTTTTTTTAGGDTADQSISNNNNTQVQPKVDAWGSVDRDEEIKPIVKIDQAADGWGTSATTASASATDDGWGSAPTKALETQLVDTEQETPKQNSPKTRTVQAEHGWGALPELTSVKTPDMVEFKKQQEPESSASANTSPQDNWNVPPITTTTIKSSSIGWEEQPTVAASHHEGWNTVTESKNVSGQANAESTSHVETTTTTITQKAIGNSEVDTRDETPAMPNASPSVATSTDGWGKPEEALAAAQATWSNNETDNWNTPQSANNNNGNYTRGGIKSTSPSHTEIPPEERASSSWANAKLDVQVHTTPSNFSKIDYSRRHNSSRRNNSSTYQQHPQPQLQATLDDSSMQQQQQEWDPKTTSESWGVDATVTPYTGWNTIENENVQSEWTTTTPSKIEETAEVDAGWDSKPAAKDTSPWNAASEATYTKSTSNWNESSAATTFDQSNSSSSSSVRGDGGWSNSRSSNSTNWNADREWNNKMRTNQQSKKSRSYFSGRNTTTMSTDMHVNTETASNSTEGFNTPETSAWGHFQSTGDDDSDVEIILEAEEEPEWSKEDEQVLGMTAPADTQHQPYSPPSNRMTKSYLSQHQHDSGQSSPRPKYNRKPATTAVNSGRHGNSKPAHQHRSSQYDDNWRQPREEADAFRPVYYPAPVAHHPSYMPMIPNGNGTPMYAMPIPMGPSSSSPSNMVARGGSASPSYEPSSSTGPHKFYTSSPPNVQQLPPGYEANGMVYYSMDPSAIYSPQQAFYYYAPPPPQPPQAQSPQMMANNNNHDTSDGYDSMRRSSISPLHHHQYLQQAEEDGWGPTPDTVETEAQWRTTTMNKSSQHDLQNRKQQQQPANQYYYPQHSHHY